MQEIKLNMNFILLIIAIVLCPLFSAENSVKICNGVFKCVSATSLRICLNGQLVTSEFHCPNSMYCSEKSNTICTNTQDFFHNTAKDNEATKSSNILTLTTTSITSIPKCIQAGRYPVPNSGCLQFLLCTVTTNGFLKQIINCPSNTFFDPLIGRCKKNFICPDISTTITTTTEASVQGNCPRQGTFPIPNTNCTKYFRCIVTSNGFFKQILECEKETNFDPNIGKCTERYACPTIYQATTEKLINDITTEITTADVTTKVTTIKNITDEVTTYEVTTNEVTTDAISTSAALPNCSEQGGLEIIIPECLKEGRFAISGVACKKYILCVKTSIGFKEKEYQCPNGTNFDPDKGRCLKNYQCTECQTTPSDATTEITTAEGTTTENVTDEVTTNEETTNEVTSDAISTSPALPNCSEQGGLEIIIPECLKEGRFAISGVACKKYILCVKTSIGFKEKEYQCPNGTNFDPDKGRCLKNYQCTECQTTPSDATTEITTAEGTTTENVTDEVTTNEETTNEVTSDAISTSPALPNCSEQGGLEIIIPECLKEGRFAISGVACKKYILCVKTSIGFKEKEYQCPNGTNFDPDKGRCLKNYQCTECQTTPSDATTEITTAEGTTTENVTDEVTTNEETTNEVTSDAISTSPALPNCSEQGGLEIIIPECLKEGRFAISGVACKKYILCVKTSIGFKEKEYQCPNGTNFDPDKGRCLKNYQCTECQTTPSDATTEITTAEGTTTENVTDEVTTNEETTNEVTSDAISTSPALPNCSEQGGLEIIIPECLKEGRFAISGVACKKYILCVKTSIGFKEKEYQCPNGTNFDPDKGRCLKNYQCTECQTTPSDATTEITTAEGTTTENVTDEVTTNEETTNEVTSDAISTSPALPKCSEQGGLEIIIPECLKEGRFTISGVACKKYILCVITSIGFKEKEYQCPNGTNFDPEKGRCLKNYQCTECQTTPSDATTEITTAEGTTTENVTDEVTTNEETTNEVTSDAISTSPALPNCSEQGGLEIIIPECLKEGRFAISGVACKKYILCVKTSIGFKEKEYQCPTGTNFDPEKGRCLQNYQCTECRTTPRDITTEITTAEESTTENVADEVTTNEMTTDAISTSPALPNCSEQGGLEIIIPECLKEGRFAISGVACKKYILCVKTSLGFKEKEYQCPNGTNFDPQKGRCLKTYQCIECQTTPLIEVKTNIISISPEVPNCLLQGRLEISGTKCKKFALCIETSNGFTSSVHSCPNGSLFDPIKKLCSANYICEEEDIRTCTTVGLYPNPTSTNCKFYYDCTEQETNNIQGILKECKNGLYFDPELQQCSFSYMCQNKNNSLLRAEGQNVISPRFLVNGQCTTVGRYLIQFSNCKNYVYCSANVDGTLKATNFTCPTTTVFNQAIQKCTSSASYTCPDSFCVNNPGLISWANPNVKDCSTYIVCEPVYDNIGMILGYTGVIRYCQQGTKFNPMLQICDSMYVCPTNING